MIADIQLVFVRHGETEWTEKGLLHGHRDSPLSATGRRQAELTAERLRTDKFDALYSSSLGRAMETASVLGEAVGLTPEPLDGLKEMYYGWMEGKPNPPFEPDGSGRNIYRPLVMLILRLTGEKPDHLFSRVKDSIHTMIEKHPASKLLTVTHWGVLSVIMATLLDNDPKRWRDYDHWAACGVTEIHARNGKWHVIRLNDAGHLQE